VRPASEFLEWVVQNVAPAAPATKAEASRRFQLNGMPLQKGRPAVLPHPTFMRCPLRFLRQWRRAQELGGFSSGPLVSLMAAVHTVTSWNVRAGAPKNPQAAVFPSPLLALGCVLRNVVTSQNRSSLVTGRSCVVGSSLDFFFFAGSDLFSSPDL